MEKYDYIIVGIGFAGATLANVLANAGKKILLIDKRAQIGGNMYDYYDTNGVLVHKYGPHIFHTNFTQVFDYIKQFATFVPYNHKVLANINGTLIPVPFNFTSIEKLFSKEEAQEIEKKLLDKKVERISILELLNDSDEQIKNFGKFVYENIFVYYTAKQWGIHPDKVDKSVINRVPVVIGYNDLYFADKYQYMPKEGFTHVFTNMLNNPNITVELNTNACDILSFNENKIIYDGQEFLGQVIYSGAIDELFNYCFGELPYRSLNLVFEQYDKTYFQSNSVVNYTVSEDYTRISEFKYLSNQHIEGKTTILKEFSMKYDRNNPLASTPYYPIQNSENISLYEKYKNKASTYNNLHLIGRLAEYKYYNMDAVILNALNLADKLLNK